MLKVKSWRNKCVANTDNKSGKTAVMEQTSRRCQIYRRTCHNIQKMNFPEGPNNPNMCPPNQIDSKYMKKQ